MFRVRASSFGASLRCPLRAAYDAEADPNAPRETSHAADFGSLTHCLWQWELGADGAPPRPTSVEDLAKQYPGIKDPAGAFQEALKLAKRAATIIQAWKPSATWIAEKNYDTGPVTGHVDLLAEDGSCFADLKTYGKSPTLPIATSYEYLVQMATYAVLTGARETLILYAHRDTLDVKGLVYDWTDPRYSRLLEYVLWAAETLNTASGWAVPVPSQENCMWCRHTSRCPGVDLFTPNSIVEQQYRKSFLQPERG